MLDKCTQSAEMRINLFTSVNTYRGNMDVRKMKRYLSPKQLHDEKILPWSPKTIERRIKQEGLPAIKDTGGWLVDLEDLDKWMRERKVYDGGEAS